MQTSIKICGITSLDDAEKCRECGVDFIGLIFAETPRRVAVENAARIARRMSGKMKIVGVFDRYDATEVARIVDRVRLDYLQVYYHPNNGKIEMPPRPLISSVWVGEGAFRIPPYPCHYLLLDFKNVGKIGGLSDEDWQRVNRGYSLFLAGGIDPDNVAGVIEKYRPFGIDCARGTESEPGIKDHDKIERLVERVRSCSK